MIWDSGDQTPVSLVQGKCSSHSDIIPVPILSLLEARIIILFTNLRIHIDQLWEAFSQTITCYSWLQTDTILIIVYLLCIFSSACSSLCDVNSHQSVWPLGIVPKDICDIERLLIPAKYSCVTPLQTSITTEKEACLFDNYIVCREVGHVFLELMNVFILKYDSKHQLWTVIDIGILI